MSSKDYRIEPPPNDKGAEPLFRVIYAIDVGAADERKAAEAAWQMMRAEDAFEPVMIILDGRSVTVEQACFSQVPGYFKEPLYLSL